MCFSLSALCTYTITRRESKRLSAASDVLGTLGIIAYRFELRARCALARWRSDRRALFAGVLLLAIAEFPHKSQCTRPDCNAPARTATFSCELRIYSRIAACLLGRRIFRPAAAIPRERWCACGAVASAGLLGALDRDIGGEGGRRQILIAAGVLANGWATAVSTANLRLARGGGGTRLTSGLPILRTMREMQRVAKLCGMGVICLSGNARSLADGGTWALKMLSWGLAGFGNARVILPIPEFARFGGRVWGICKAAVRRYFGGLFAWNFFHGAVNNLSVL